MPDNRKPKVIINIPSFDRSKSRLNSLRIRCLRLRREMGGMAALTLASTRVVQELTFSRDA